MPPLAVSMKVSDLRARVASRTWTQLSLPLPLYLDPFCATRFLAHITEQHHPSPSHPNLSDNHPYRRSHASSRLDLSYPYA